VSHTSILLSRSQLSIHTKFVCDLCHVRKVKKWYEKKSLGTFFLHFILTRFTCSHLLFCDYIIVHHDLTFHRTRLCLFIFLFLTFICIFNVRWLNDWSLVHFYLVTVQLEQVSLCLKSGSLSWWKGNCKIGNSWCTTRRRWLIVWSCAEHTRFLLLHRTLCRFQVWHFGAKNWQQLQGIHVSMEINFTLSIASNTL
jgi:hypothetical protein